MSLMGAKLLVRVARLEDGMDIRLRNKAVRETESKAGPLGSYTPETYEMLLQVTKKAQFGNVRRHRRTEQVMKDLGYR